MSCETRSIVISTTNYNDCDLINSDIKREDNCQVTCELLSSVAKIVAYQPAAGERFGIFTLKNIFSNEIFAYA